MSVSPEVRPVGWAGLSRTAKGSFRLSTTSLIWGIWAANATWIVEIGTASFFKITVPEAYSDKIVFGSSILAGITAALLASRTGR